LLDVIFNETSTKLSKSGAITGEIYFQLKGSHFPEENWNDFVVVILIWWNKSANLLISSPVGTSADFRFMDGPFNIHGKKKDNENVTLNFIRRNLNGENVLNTIDVDVFELKRSILEVSRKVLRVVRSNKWLIDDDINELEKIISL
jgi:hypothetical protein